MHANIFPSGLWDFIYIKVTHERRLRPILGSAATLPFPSYATNAADGRAAADLPSSIIGDPRSISSSVLSLDLVKVGDLGGLLAFWLCGVSSFVHIQTEAYILTLITTPDISKIQSSIYVRSWDKRTCQCTLLATSLRLSSR